MRVYTSKLTPDSVVTYLFHDYGERSLWLFCIKVQYTSTDRRLPVLRVCATFEGLTEFCFVFRCCQFAGFHVANRAATRFLLLRNKYEEF